MIVYELLISPLLLANIFNIANNQMPFVKFFADNEFNRISKLESTIS
jgi:hypothetical protein